MLFKSTTVSTHTNNLKELENKFLNGIMTAYLKRKCTDSDARNITLNYHNPLGQDVYDLYFGKLMLGTVRKSTLFGKQKMKFTPSAHYTHITKQ